MAPSGICDRDVIAAGGRTEIPLISAAALMSLDRQAKMHTVSYTSTRGEIWRWYWRAWARPAGLWRYHVFIGLFIAAAYGTRDGFENFAIGRFFVTLLVAMPLCVLLFSLWPQLRFKAERRSLTINADGWTSRVGKISGSRAWADIRAIEDSDDTIAIIGNNGNALIVPRRAFPDEEARREFINDARCWHAAVAA